MTENDFRGGKIADEYELIKLVVPHYDETERSVGNVVREYCCSIPQSVRIIRVLEIGSGTGFTTDLLLKADPRVRVTCIDESEAMIRQAEKKLARKIADSKVRIYKFDAFDWFAPSSSIHQYDIVASAYTIHNFTQDYRQRFLKALYQNTKGPFLFINADVIAQNDEKEYRRVLEERIARLVKFDEAGYPQLRREWHDHYLFDADPIRRMSEKDYETQLGVAGFTSIRKIYRKELEATYVARKA